MSARSKARKRALDILYGAQVRHVPVATALADAERQAEDQPERASSFPYAREAVSGFIDHQSSIDELIAEYSEQWTIDRMPAVDLAVLRLGAWEILHNPDVPDAVAIAEAGRLAEEFSTDASRRFVTGVLSAISKH